MIEFKSRGDTRLFRLTYDSGTVKYGTRQMAGPAIAQTRKILGQINRGGANYRIGLVVQVEVTNAEATAGWSDVTAEFFPTGNV